VPAGGGAPREIGTAGSLLGILAEPALNTTRITLQPGDQVVFYTDGLTENGQPRLTTQDLLELVGASRADTADGTRDHIMRRYDELDRRPRHDDVAVVAVQLRSTEVRPRREATSAGRRPTVLDG
jgi:serine phosphatase RsbU (regulator of sigma subunit)